MERKHKMILAGGGALLVLLFLNRTPVTTNIDGEIVEEETTYDPYGQSNPGIYDGFAPGFNSVINVDAKPEYFGSLSQQYIPLFGMIGVVAAGVPGKTVYVEKKAPVVSGYSVSNRSSSSGSSKNSYGPGQSVKPVNNGW